MPCIEVDTTSRAVVDVRKSVTISTFYRIGPMEPLVAT
jgi:hypothetical protein